jgi:methylated-DNA-[protein]-cysteine S-methyltransferase
MTPDISRGPQLSLKKTLYGLLSAGRLEEIAEMAVERKRVLGSLISLTYDSDPQICWRAVESMGLAAQRLAPDDPGAVKEHLRRLFWLITEESGGICWRAPESMAEVTSRLHQEFGEYIPIIVHLLLEFAEEDLEHFRPGVLWAIGRLGSLAQDHLPEVLPAIVASLDVPDPQARGMAVWCLGRVGRSELLRDRPNVLSDEGVVELYENRLVSETTVGQLAQATISSGD